MDDSLYRLAIIVGSVRSGRFGSVVANWYIEQARARNDAELDVMDLAKQDAPDSSRMAAADGFVVVTPEYNHSFPGPLKTTIDRFYQEWHAKPVAFVSYGGISGGLRAVEHLRGVFAELHTVTVRDTVSFHGAHQQFDDAGQPIDAEAVNGAAKAQLDSVAWWARALRQARQQVPYQG